LGIPPVLFEKAMEGERETSKLTEMGRNQCCSLENDHTRSANGGFEFLYLGRFDGVFGPLLHPYMT